MKISIWGGTGYAGRHIAAEAAKRGHDVVVFSRTPGEQIDGVTYETGSILDSAARARSLEADIVVSALSPRGDMADKMRPAVQELISEATSKGVRIAVVGGAGSLLDEPGGTRLVDSAGFPDEYKAEALTLAGILADLQSAGSSLNWFFVSPPDIFGAHANVPTTGTYRVGGDVRLHALDGSSLGAISGPDFGLAFVDEIEQNNHCCERFTVAS